MGVDDSTTDVEVSGVEDVSLGADISLVGVEVAAVDVVSARADVLLDVPGTIEIGKVEVGTDESCDIFVIGDIEDVEGGGDELLANVESGKGEEALLCAGHASCRARRRALPPLVQNVISSACSFAKNARIRPRG